MTTTPPAEGATGAAPAEVSSIVDFTLPNLTISVGDTVTWRNDDGAPHTTTGDDGLFDSGSLGTGAEFSHTFSEAGTFRYTCTIHPSMVATITVE